MLKHSAYNPTGLRVGLYFNHLQWVQMALARIDAIEVIPFPH